MKRRFALTEPCNCDKKSRAIAALTLHLNCYLYYFPPCCCVWPSHITTHRIFKNYHFLFYHVLFCLILFFKYFQRPSLSLQNKNFTNLLYITFLWMYDCLRPIENGFLWSFHSSLWVRGLLSFRCLLGGHEAGRQGQSGGTRSLFLWKFSGTVGPDALTLQTHDRPIEMHALVYVFF